MPEYYLGIDVGYSEHRPSTGLCLITVGQAYFSWRCLNTGTDRDERLRSLRNLIPRGTALSGVGIDGPLVHELEMVDCYRPADALLSRGNFRGRCQPGQTNSGNGQHLHRHATNLANLVLALQQEGYLKLAKAIHLHRIHQYRIVEAFPDAFLAFLLAEPDFQQVNVRLPRVDRYWEITVGNHLYLHDLIESLAPGSDLADPLEAIVDHDHRAAFICALAALCVTREEYVAVGAQQSGDIILPPSEVWGAGPQDQGTWAEAILLVNVATVNGDQIQNDPCNDFNQARVISNGNHWMGHQ